MHSYNVEIFYPKIDKLVEKLIQKSIGIHPKAGFHDVVLDADSINGTEMMGQEVHSLAIPNGTSSGQRLSLVVKTTTNNVSILPAGIISGSFGSLNDSMGTTTLEFIWISESSHNAWHQI